jgi:predicted Zn finger-like uncharacterized protein
MYTVCPKCALTLVVTAADLRIAQGFVRCGRCSNVFNALARLSEERQTKTAQPQPQPAPPREPESSQPPPQPQDDEDAIPESALEFDPQAADVSKVFVEPPPNPEWDAATGKFRALARETAEPDDTQPEAVSASLEDTGTHLEIELDASFLEAAHSSAVDEPAAADERTAEPLHGSERRATAPREAEYASTQAAAAARESETAPETEAGSADEAQSGDAAETGYQRVSRLSYLWGAGTGALVLLLAAQLVHHYRSELATNAQLYGPLTAVYSALGIPLVPRWNLGAYDVRQLGASADSADTGRITVRASVKNVARQAQPLPLLRVTLQDRFGNRIAARDVPPQSYLPRAVPPSSFLSAGQRIDAEMAFVDPGSSAVGFEIDACLPSPEGAIACANEPSAR